MKRYGSCALSMLGCAAGFAIVHGMAYSVALGDKKLHLTSRDAFWQAVFYDFLIGIPVSALCGWFVASYLRSRRPTPVPSEDTDVPNESA